MKFVYVVLTTVLSISTLFPQNYSLSFDGVDDYVDFGDVLDQTGSFSVSAWVYPEDAEYTTIAAKMSHPAGYFGWNMVVDNRTPHDNDGTKFQVYEDYYGPGTAAVTPRIINQWINYIGVFEAGVAVKLYENGNLVSTNTSSVPTGLSNNTGALFIGALIDSLDWPFKGKIDDFSLWNIALAQTEIQTIMNNGLTGAEPGLVGYWDFHEGSGMTLTDKTSNGNNGTIHGATWSTDIHENRGLVAYYPFNGNADDESGNGNNGITEGHSPTLVPDRFGNPNSAYNFDGVDDFIQIPNSASFDIVNQITISYWIKLESSAPYSQPYYILDKIGAWGTAQRLWSIHFGFFSANTWWSPALLPDTDYNLTLTYNGETIIIYINGTVAQTFTDSSLIPLTTGDLIIGKYLALDMCYFDGTLDDIRIYNRGLSSTEVDSLYNLTVIEGPSTPQNLTASPGNQEVLLNWDANSESDMYQYNIYRYSAPPSTLIGSVLHPVTTYVDTGLTNGLTYHYLVTAVDSAGNESEASNIVDVIPVNTYAPYNNFLWSARISGRVGNAVDLNNYFGAIEGATDSDEPDPFDEPEPPHPPSNYISLYFDQGQQIGNRSSVMAYPAEWGLSDATTQLNIDTDLDRYQPFTLELWLASTDINNIQIFSYRYGYGSSLDHLIWAEDSTAIEIEFPQIPFSIEFITTNLSGYQFVIDYPPTDSMVYALGGESLYLYGSTMPNNIVYNVYYYSYISTLWQYLGNSNGYNVSFSWSETPVNDSGFFRVINFANSDISSTVSGDVTFFDNYTSLYEGWNFTSIPQSGGDGGFYDRIWHNEPPQSYYLFTYINGVGWVPADTINHNKGYAVGLTGEYRMGYVDSSVTNMDLSIDIGSGWNLIGSPFNFDKSLHDAKIVSWSDINDTVSFDSAVANGWIIGTVYDYGDNSNYSTAEVLAPWKSYWLASLVDSMTFLYPDQQSTGSRDRDDEWIMTINSVTDIGVTSTIEFGYNEFATNGFDPGYDFPKPPPFPENGYLNIFVTHNEWENSFGNRYMSDFRGDLVNQIWTIDILNNNQPFNLNWQTDYTQPSGIYLYLIVENDTIDMFTNNGISLPDSVETPFQIWATDQYLSVDENALSLPKEFALHQNYPNPFNPFTKIRYDLPENSSVQIAIYDMLGRKIRTVINQRQDAGHKTVIWNGMDDIGNTVGTGLYLYMIKAGDFTKTKKMILLK